MPSYWLVWVIGVALLLAAGFVTAFVPRWRARAHARAVAWATVRVAIESARVSRDTAAVPVTKAEHLLARAEAIAANRGGLSAATAAAGYAQRARDLWRAAADA